MWSLYDELVIHCVSYDYMICFLSILPSLDRRGSFPFVFPKVVRLTLFQTDDVSSFYRSLLLVCFNVNLTNPVRSSCVSIVLCTLIHGVFTPLFYNKFIWEITKMHESQQTTYQIISDIRRLLRGDYLRLRILVLVDKAYCRTSLSALWLIRQSFALDLMLSFLRLRLL